MSNSVGDGKLVYLASQQGSNPSPGTYVFTMENPITTNWDVMRRDRVRVALRAMTLPNTWRTVTEANDAFVIDDEAYLLPRGQPSATAIATHLTAAIIARGVLGDTKVEYDATSLSLCIRFDDAAVHTIAGEGTTARELLGFPIPVQGQGTVMAPRPVDISGPRHIMVTVNLPMETADSSKRTRGTLAAVPVDGCPGAIMHYQPADPFWMVTSFDQLNTLIIDLTDEAYVPVDLRGARFALVLQFA